MKVLTLLLIAIVSCNISVAQNNAKDVPTARLTEYELKPEYRERFRKIVGNYVKFAVARKSNIMAEAYFELENPSRLWLIERWTSKKAPDKFSKTIASLSKKALIKPATVYHVNDLEPLSRQQWRKPARKQDKPLTVMLFVDAKQGTEQDFKTIYHKAMPQFRSEAGVVTYQLSAIEGDETKFVTYEKFRSDEAFQYHLKFPPIQPVIDYLNTNIKKPPFQDGIHNLIEFAPLTRE